MPNPDFTPMIVLLSVFVPLGFVGITTIALLTYHRRASQLRQLGSELVQQMLQRDMTADDIERVLLAWHADPHLAAKLRRETKPLKKFEAA